MQSEKVHPLLCPARNPASVVLLKFARNAEWMALHALALCTSRLLLAAQRDDGTFDEDLQVVQGLAELGMEERFRGLLCVSSRQIAVCILIGNLGRDKGVKPDRENWKKAHELYLLAFKAPKASHEQKKLARILKKPVPESIEKDLFEYDAFLHGLGRMSLSQCALCPLSPLPPMAEWIPCVDLEAHGGLYTLHSHLNHACTPNVSIRHFDRHTALSRITVVARAAIEPGDELLITYVNPLSDYRERRRRLLEWGFGHCRCDTCLMEEREAKASGTYTEETDELADQLRAGLGLV